MKATQHLKDEHEEIKLMLSIMQKISREVGSGKNLNSEHFAKIIDFEKGFLDLLHHGKEELILFPAMEAKGVTRSEGSISLELKEHEMGRVFIQSLSKSFEDYKTDASKGALGIFAGLLNYSNLLRSHIEKENNILFWVADEVLNEDDQEEMMKAFEKYEKEVVGVNKLEEYRRTLKELKAVYL
jgi:hemerythrin-like domain-containing protein